MSDWEHLLPAMQGVAEWLACIRRTGSFSIGFVRELAWHQQNRGYDVHSIYDEIRRLEDDQARGTTTKDATPFTGRILNGLWHKHHHQTLFMVKNLTEEIKRGGFMEQTLAPFIGMEIDDDVSAKIAHAMVIGAYESRCGRGAMTGEWIVFEPRASGGNYYLTLASHKEGDDVIAERVETYRGLDRGLSPPAGSEIREA